MGINYSAKLLVGIPAEVLFVQKTTSTESVVTRYDPVTGVPSQKVETQYNTKFYWMDEETNDYPDELAQSIGLECILGDYMSGDQAVIEKDLGDLDRYENKVYIKYSQEDIQSAISEVQSKLTAVGINEEVSVFLMNQIS